MDDVFTIRSSALPDGTRVVGFRGTEGISTPYAFEIFLSLGAEDFDLGDAITARATLTLDRQDGRPPFQFHGLFSEVAFLHELGGRALVRAVLVPKLWHLTQTHHSRIFTKESIPDILEAILEDGGLTSDDYTLKLSRQYAPEEHVCQYQESHFDFISRWMEREGLYYYFEQGNSREKLIITDNKSFHDDLGTGAIRFYPLTGSDVTAKESLHSFMCRHRALPGSIRFKDYDPTKPKLDVSGGAPVSKTGLGEIAIHGGRFFTPEAGKKLATLRAEEMLAREIVYTGSGTAFYLRPGYPFELEDYARSPAGAKYLPTLVEHYGNQTAKTAELKELTGLDLDDVYRVEVTAIPDKVQFRAERKTPWPRVYGTEHGVIDGEASTEYAQIDEHGRYLVRFAFDESGLDDGKASTRVRMMQPHGGGVEGWHFPLRKGTEVLFTFLGGDPDRPVIAGVVPNALTPSPVTSGNHTRNVIQTGGRNRLELEDKAGFQRITLSTPHANTYIRMGSPNDQDELIVKTDKNALIQTGADYTLIVGGNVKETLAERRDTTIGTGRSETISAGGLHQTVTGGWYQTVTGGGIQDVTGTYRHTVSSRVSQHYDALDLIVDSSVSHKCGACTYDYDSLVLSTEGFMDFNAESVKMSVKGEMTIVTPKFEVTTPSHITDVVDFDFAYAKKTEVSGIAMEANGLEISASGLKIEAVGFKLENKGVEIKELVTHIQEHGIKAITTGLRSELAGIWTIA